MKIDEHFQCQECKKIFSARSSWREHVRSQHELVVYECDQCSYKINNNSKLTIHRKTIHEGFRYSCDFCDWKGLALRLLRTHIKSKHGEDNLIKSQLKHKIKQKVDFEQRRQCPICFVTLKKK